MKAVEMAKESKWRGVLDRMKAVVPVVLLSVLAFELALLAGNGLQTWEPSVHDLFMRWRYHLLPSPEELVHPDVAAIGIDASTQEKFGRFGAGAWLTKQPIIDQLSFIDKYVKPSVIVYDIIFEDPLGRHSRKNRVSESEKKLGLVVQQLASVKENPGVLAHPVVLGYMNGLSFEQGTAWLAHTLAAMKVPVVLGYYFRGGWLDPQVVSVRQWSEEDLTGDSDGDGMRIPYLSDARIPESDIHFSASIGPEAYGWAPNAKLPAQDLLDYSVLGFVNCPRDLDGIVRRVPLVTGFKYRDRETGVDREVFTPSLALLPYLMHVGCSLPLADGVVEVFLGREIVVHPPEGAVTHIPIDEMGCLTLNFDVAFDDFNAVNLVDTAPPSRAREEFKLERAAQVKGRLEGKIAVVGVTAVGVDSGPTPLSTKTPFMHIHLTALNNMLTGSYLREVSPRERTLLYLFVWLLVTLVCSAEKSARLGPITIALTGGYFSVTFAMIYGSIRILPLITPLLYIVLCSFSVMTYRFFTEERAKRKIRGMFSTMVSDRVLEYLEQNPGSFSLKGAHADVTVFSSDVGGFTSISEQLPPERLTGLLNSYFTTVTDCIMSNGGYLDKYVGDGVMAVWGAPFPEEGHALKACRSSLEQVRLLKELNPKLKAEYGMELSMRIGLNSGSAIAGNMGSSRKFQYTVMGDTVNLASRLEPANKDFGTSIIIGPVTRDSVKDVMLTRLLAKIIVKGKTESASIYELVGEKSILGASELEFYSAYDAAMRLFLDRDWQAAIAKLDALLELREDDGPSVFLRSQALAMAKNPPPDGWQGEYVRHEKD